MEAPAVNKVGDGETVVTGLTDADSFVKVLRDGMVIGEGKSNAEGAYSVVVPQQTGGTILKVTAVDSYGRGSAEALLPLVIQQRLLLR